jgi:hypothetical protein
VKKVNSAIKFGFFFQKLRAGVKPAPTEDTEIPRKPVGAGFIPARLF